MKLILDEQSPDELTQAVKQARPKVKTASIHGRALDGLGDAALLDTHPAPQPL